MTELIHGDCLVEMQNIPDKSIDMILCDLPYEVLNKGNKHAQWDRIIPFDKLWEQYNRIIKDNGAIVLFAQGMFTAQMMMSNLKMWRYNLVWQKGNRTSGFLNANRMPLRNHEDICVFYKSLPTYNPQMWKGRPNHTRTVNRSVDNNRCYGTHKRTPTLITENKYPVSVVSFELEHKDFFHPTQKPVALLEWLIKTYSNEGDIILDNTMGSGSTGVACVNNNRNFIGIELNEEYFKIAEKRINDAIVEKESTLF